jgi:hypothetical protein
MHAFMRLIAFYLCSAGVLLGLELRTNAVLTSTSS